MHEVSMAAGILDMVEQAARTERFASVKRLRVRAGAFSGVDVAALRFALEALAPATLLDGAQLLIDEPPGSAWCWDCQAQVLIAQRADACPACGGYRLAPGEGNALRVVELVVGD